MLSNLGQPRLIGLVAAVLAGVTFLFLLIRSTAGPSPTGFGTIRSGISGIGHSLLDDVHNKTLGFEQIYVLNLPSRTDHRDAITLAAALSGFRVNFIDGVIGSEVPAKSLPDTGEANFENDHGLLGSWRAHMNAMQEIVQNDVSSALIFEDDVDWDYRLKDLLRDFARSANAIQYIDREQKIGLHLLGHDPRIDYKSLPAYTAPSFSPYGDDWDILWLGHCGMRIDPERTHVVHEQDPTVPQLQYLKSWEEGVPSPLTPYGNHVRMVGRNDGTCTLAYAVSQTGARKILYDMAVNKLWSAFDVMLASFCQNGARCLGSLPQLFDHHRAKGQRSKDSDISGGGGYREVAVTNNIRWSVRLNMKKLLDGEVTELDDQYPDV